MFHIILPNSHQSIKKQKNNDEQHFFLYLICVSLDKQLTAMNGKNIAIVSYLTIVGWIIALVSHNNSLQKEPIASFHLRQSLGIILTGLVLTAFPPFLGIGFASGITGALVFVLWVLGFISAVQGEEKEVPVIGNLYQDWFKGIK